MTRRQAAKFALALVAFGWTDLNILKLRLAAIVRPFLSRVVACKNLAYG